MKDEQNDDEAEKWRGRGAGRRVDYISPSTASSQVSVDRHLFNKKVCAFS